MKKKKYNNGGELLQQLLPLAASFIPGGQIAAPLIGGVMNQLMQPEKLTPPTAQQVNYSTNPYGKLAFGGPIDPLNMMARETTFVKPNPFIVPVSPDVALGIPQMPAPNFLNAPMWNDGTVPNKSKSKDRFREKANGGNLINDGFKQFDTGSHASGNDLTVDQFGNPTNNGVAEVQNQENMYNNFVLSDTLTNPKTGNKFSTDAKNINKKYEKARLYDDSKNALDFEMNMLQALNQSKINKMESRQMAQGGPLDTPKSNSIYDMGYTVDPNTERFMTIPNDGDFMNLTLSPDPQLPMIDTNYGTSINNLNPVNQNQNILAKPITQVIPGNTNSMNGLDAIGLGLKGVALAGSISDAFKPAEVENLQLPDYSQADRYMREATVDYSQSRQDAVGVSNMASNNIRSMSSNPSQYLSRQSARLGQLQDVLSRIGEQQTNANSQLNLTKSQYNANKSIDNTNRFNQNKINNQQNQAAANSFDRSLMSDLSMIGTQFGEEARSQKVNQNNREINMFQNNQIIAALNASNPNWQLDPNIIANLKAGNIDLDSLLKYKQ